MVNHEEMKKVVLREKEKSLHISRIPTKVKSEFMQLSESEFAGDYGMLIKWLLDLAKDSMFYKQNVDTKLNYIIQLLEQSTASQEEEPEEKELKLFSGRKIKSLGEKNE